MDINFLRSFGTLFIFIAFLCVCFWAYHPKRKKDFSEAEMLPFKDEFTHKKTTLNTKKGAKNHV